MGVRSILQLWACPCGENSPDANLVDEIWIILSFIHYHGKEMAPFSLRYEMCVRLFTEELNLGYDTDK